MVAGRSGRRDALVGRTVQDLLDALLAGAVRAAEELAARLEPVADDRHLAVEAARRDGLDRALERVEHVRRSPDRELERLVVRIAARLTGLHGHCRGRCKVRAAIGRRGWNAACCR